MSKRIVVGLDGSPFADAATQAAIERAQHSGGTVIGVAVIDRPGIERSQSGAGAGASFFASSAIDQKLEDALKRTRDFINQFAERCRQAKVNYEFDCDEGVPFNVLLDHGRACDLIVIGLKTYFHFETSTAAGNTLSRLIHHPVTPVLAVPETWVAPKHVLIAYNSSVFSARAMGAFLHQQVITPFADDVTLLNVEEDGEAISKQDMNHAEKYLRSYGLKVRRETKQGDVGDTILNTALELAPCMIVMGSHHGSWIKELLTGSVAEKLMEDSRTPLFVYQ